MLEMTLFSSPAAFIHVRSVHISWLFSTSNVSRANVASTSAGADVDATLLCPNSGAASFDGCACWSHSARQACPSLKIPSSVADESSLDFLSSQDASYTAQHIQKWIAVWHSLRVS